MPRRSLMLLFVLPLLSTLLAAPPTAAQMSGDFSDPFCEGAWGIQTGLSFTRGSQIKQAPVRVDLERTTMTVGKYGLTTELQVLFGGDAPKPPPDKRLVVKAKKVPEGAFSFGTAYYDRVLMGEIDARATVAIDDLEGIVDGQTRAAIEIDIPPGGPPFSFTFLEARFNSATPGFTVTGNTNLGPLTTDNPTVISNYEVELRVRKEDNTLTTYTRDPATVGKGGDGDGWIIVSEQTVDGASPFEISLGAVALGTGAQVFFDDIRVEGGEIGGEVELPLIQQIADATESFTQAGNALTAEGDGEEPAALTQTGIDDTVTAMAAIQAAVDGDTLLETTQGKRALSALKKGIKQGTAALKKLQSGNEKKIAKATKNLQKAIEFAATAAANLAGHKAKSAKTVPLGELPPD